MALTELEILEQISKHWVSYRKKWKIQQNSCILACNFARQILLRFDIDHEVLPIGTTVFNRRGWELFGVPAKQLPDDAWHVHCSSQSLGKGFGGHVIIQTENHFFDPTVGAFSRPEKEMMFGETVIVPLANIRYTLRSAPTSFGLSRLGRGCIPSTSRSGTPFTEGHPIGRYPPTSWGYLR